MGLQRAISVSPTLEPPDEWLLSLRFVLGLTFVVAGLAKLGARDDLARTVTRYGILPARMSPFLATWLPRFELLTGVLLVVGLLGRVAAGLAAVALTAFTFGAIVNLLRGRVMDCGCFGPSRIKRVTWRTVVRNVLLVMAALILMFDPAFAFSIDSLWMHSGTLGIPAADATAVALASSAALVLVLLLAEALDLARLLRRRSRET